MSQSYVWDSFDYDNTSYNVTHGLYQQITTNSKPKNNIITNDDGTITFITSTENIKNTAQEIELKNEENMAKGENIHERIKRMAMEEALAKLENRRRYTSINSQGVSFNSPPPSHMGGKSSDVFEDVEIKREKEKTNIEKRNQASEKNFRDVDPCNHVGSDDSDFLKMIKNMDKENNRSQPKIVKNLW